MTPPLRSRPARAVLASACALALLSGGPVGPRPVAAQEAASAVQDVTLSDLSLTLGATVLRIPKLTVSGTRLSRDELAGILRADAPEPWAVRLARLDAASVTVPVLISEHAGPGPARQSVTYRDVTARDVRAGRIAELSAAGAAVTVTDGAHTGSGTYGRIQATDLDLAALARLAGVPGDGKGPVQRVYASLLIAEVTYTDAAGTTARIARIEGHDLGGRQVPGGWSGALDLLGAGLPGLAGGAPPAERARVAGAGADLLEGLAAGSLEIRGLSLSHADPEDPLLVEVGRVGYAGAEAGTVLEAVAVSRGRLRARLGRLALAGVSLAPTVAALRALARPEAQPGADEPLRLLPALGALTLQDLSLDLPTEPAKPTASGAPGSAPGAADPLAAGRTVSGKANLDKAAPGKTALDKTSLDQTAHLALREAALSFGPPHGGVPTATRLSLSGLTLPARLAGGLPVLDALPAYGYHDLDLDLAADAAWDEDRREVAVREISLSGRDMGRLRLSGTVGGIGPEVFASTKVPASTLLFLTASAKALDLTIENAGLFERFLDAQAKSLSLKPDELRQEYVVASRIGVPVILGNSPGAQAIGAALGQFVTKPGRLVVTAKARNGAGLALAEFGTARTPAAVLDKLDVDAKAD